VELSSPQAELRVLEVFYHKIYKIFPLNEKIENINDQYWTLRAEEVNTKLLLSAYTFRASHSVSLSTSICQQISRTWSKHYTMRMSSECCFVPLQNSL
jgi:hypothetical protein